MSLIAALAQRLAPTMQSAMAAARVNPAPPPSTSSIAQYGQGFGSWLGAAAQPTYMGAGLGGYAPYMAYGPSDWDNTGAGLGGAVNGLQPPQMFNFSAPQMGDYAAPGAALGGATMPPPGFRFNPQTYVGARAGLARR
jgi:hypothetical protein